MRLASYIIGFGLHVVIGWFYLTAGLVGPGPYLFALWAVWLALAVLAVARRRDHLYVLATPFMAAAFWMLFVFGLGTLLDWKP
jgi:hypothetical protein